MYIYIYMLVQNASPKRIQVQMLDVVSVVADGDDVRRAPQGIILAVLSQFYSIFESLGNKTFFE